MTLADDVPDSKTLWNFCKKIIDLDFSKALFDLFVKDLESLGLILPHGKIVDASFVEVSRQGNTKAENAQIST